MVVDQRSKWIRRPFRKKLSSGRFPSSSTCQDRPFRASVSISLFLKFEIVKKNVESERSKHVPVWYNTIPTEIGNLKKLITLSLRDNAFSGQVPEEISQLSLLKTLHLDRNCLSGLLPIGLTQLPNLTNFNSRQNSFEIGSYGPGFRFEDADQVPSDWITVVDGRIESNDCDCYRTDWTCSGDYLYCPPVPPLCSRAPKGKFRQ